MPVAQRTIEDRRAAGERTPLPVIPGGRPTPREWAEPPADMDAFAQAVWREVVPQLAEAGFLARTDRQALEMYALSLGRARALREEIEWEHHDTCACKRPTQHNRQCTLGKRKRRRTLTEQFRAVTARGFTSNPLLSQEREAMREARMMGELLGLNPVGRTKLAGAGKKRNGLGALTGSLAQPKLSVVGGTPEPSDPHEEE